MFLLSQDKDEIFLTFPYFGEDYGKVHENIDNFRKTDFLDNAGVWSFSPQNLRSI